MRILAVLGSLSTMLIIFSVLLHPADTEVSELTFMLLLFLAVISLVSTILALEPVMSETGVWSRADD